MSTNSNCAFIEVAKGKWFYILEDFNAPKNAWDWRDNATAYGPFIDFDKAHQHLRDNHANPGGFWQSELPHGVESLDLTKDETLGRLIASATAPTLARRSTWY